jgi:hypothetical protein
LRDLVNTLISASNKKYVKNDKLLSNKVILLLNCSSEVGGFTDNVNALLTFCEQKNVNIKYILNGNITDTQPPKFQLERATLYSKWKPIMTWKGGKKTNKKQKKHRNTQKRNNKRRTLRK